MIFSLFGGDKKRISQMINAARMGDTESIKQLLQQGADLSLKDDEGLTAKDIAIKNANEDLIPLLS